jgi:hypothetical protein
VAKPDAPSARSYSSVSKDDRHGLRTGAVEFKNYRSNALQVNDYQQQEISGKQVKLACTNLAKVGVEGRIPSPAPKFLVEPERSKIQRIEFSSRVVCIHLVKSRIPLRCP